MKISAAQARADLEQARADLAAHIEWADRHRGDISPRVIEAIGMGWVRREAKATAILAEVDGIGRAA